MILEVAGWNMHRAETSPVPSLWGLSSQSGAHWRRERRGGREEDYGVHDMCSM